VPNAKNIAPIRGCGLLLHLSKERAHSVNDALSFDVQTAHGRFLTVRQYLIGADYTIFFVKSQVFSMSIMFHFETLGYHKLLCSHDVYTCIANVYTQDYHKLLKGYIWIDRWYYK